MQLDGDVTWQEDTLGCMMVNEDLAATHDLYEAMWHDDALHMRRQASPLPSPPPPPPPPMQPHGKRYSSSSGRTSILEVWLCRRQLQLPPIPGFWAGRLRLRTQNPFQLLWPRAARSTAWTATEAQVYRCNMARPQIWFWRRRHGNPETALPPWMEARLSDGGPSAILASGGDQSLA